MYIGVANFDNVVIAEVVNIVVFEVDNAVVATVYNVILLVDNVITLKLIVPLLL